MSRINWSVYEQNHRPKGHEEELIYAECAFLLDARKFIHDMMARKAVDAAELASRLKVAHGDILDWLSDDFDLSLAVIARIFYALDEEPQLVSK